MSLKKHPMFTDRDFAYLSAKGYSRAEIKAIWDRDLADGGTPVQWTGKWNARKFQATVYGR